MATYAIRYVTTPPEQFGRSIGHLQPFDIVADFVDPPWWTGDPLTSGFTEGNPKNTVATIVITDISTAQILDIQAYKRDRETKTYEGSSAIFTDPLSLTSSQQRHINNNGWAVIPASGKVSDLIRRKQEDGSLDTVKLTWRQ